MRKRLLGGSGWTLRMVILCVLVLGGVTPSSAEPYFKGKVIAFVVPFTAGGGTDLFGRLVARHLPRFIPGNPKAVVRNIAGAGGVTGANLAYLAKPNGLTALVSSGGSLMTGLARPKGVVFRLEEMQPIYSTPVGMVYFCRPILVSKPRDIMTAKGLIWGHVSPVSGVASGFVWAKALLGFNVEKMIWGYGGTSAANMAYTTGETNFSGQSTEGYLASMQQYVDRGEAVLLFQSGVLDENGAVVRERSVPGVPTAPELYEQIYGKKPSGKVFEAYKVVVGSRTYGKCILFPKDTPAEIMGILRKAAIDMVKDPMFLKESEMQNPKAPHYFGESLARSYPAGVSAAPEVIDHMREYLEKEYKVAFE
ncbi:MAG: hypothetical protein QME90_07430 [Thermodesulfobacteriota bacterium]|nr:hypothetical protein [Thermodesulfobacteriota bacterium]